MKFAVALHVFVILLVTALRRHNASTVSIASIITLNWPFANAEDHPYDGNEHVANWKQEGDLSPPPGFSRFPAPISFAASGTSDTQNGWECEALDACSDRFGYDAIRALHRQLDDDANGNIDVAESDEFLRDELQYENGYERHKEFHGNDKYISVDELWQAWKTSEVHNWTVEETIEWLASYVDLPQYVHNFKEKSVDGSALPRLAVNTNNFMSISLGIKDPIHKQKIALKAMDVVLFGPPRHHNYLKDVLLVMSLVIAIGGCWFAYVQHKYSQTHLRRMMRDMESLQNAEEALQELQRELDKARQEQEIVCQEKQNLERRLQDEITTAKQQLQQQTFEGLASDGGHPRVIELEKQLRVTREDLQRAEKMLESRSWAPPPTLQHWLQLTHELELRHYNAKKVMAEHQLSSAKEGCEKLRRKRSTFMGAFRIAHGSSLDDVDDRILQAKAALCEVTKDLQERLHRWRQIELLCGFPIVHNPGLLYLESVLKGASLNGSAGIHYTSGKSALIRSSSEGALIHDDSPPPYAAGISAVQELVHTSAALFLVPVPPACVGYHNNSSLINRNPHDHLPSRDSGISLASTNQLPASITCHPLANGVLANIPPPSYSSASAYDSRKESVNSLKEKSSGPFSLPRSTITDSHISSSTPALHLEAYCHSDYAVQQSLETATEEDEEEYVDDVDEGSSGRSVTPPSCASYSGLSDSGRATFSVGESFTDASTATQTSVKGGSEGNNISTHDKLLPSHDTSPSKQSLDFSDNKVICNTSKHKLNFSFTDKRKKAGNIVSVIRSGFSSSSSVTNSTESSPSLEIDGHKKKKSFLPSLKKQKTKVL